MNTDDEIREKISRFKTCHRASPTRVELGFDAYLKLSDTLRESLTYFVKTLPNGQQNRSQHSYFEGLAIVPTDMPGIKVRRCVEDAIEVAERPLLIAAHSGMQLDRFLHTFQIPKNEVRRIWRAQDLHGYGRHRHVFLLPDWSHNLQSHDEWSIRHLIEIHKLDAFEVGEHEVLGISATELIQRHHGRSRH